MRLPLSLKLSPLMLTMIERYRIWMKHRHGGHAVVGESGIPAAEGKIRSEDHRAMFIALLYDLEAQVGVLATHRRMFAPISSMISSS